MPVYEYTCEACGETTDLLRRIPDRDDPATCDCGGSLARRVVPSRIGYRRDHTVIDE